MTNIIISGPRGRMGQALLRLAKGDQSLNVLGVLDKPGLVTQKANEVPGTKTFNDLHEISNLAGAVLIEFTTPEATIEHLAAAAKLGVKAIVGSTGFSADERAELGEYAKHIALIIAPNTSLGVNVLLSIVEQLAQSLGGYDIELVEMHHRLKKDAPSGTAVALAEAAARGRNVQLAEVGRHGRSGITGERTATEIGIHSLRGGDVVGEHTMTFAGLGERVEITHKAHSRDTFAAGALVAAKWIAGKAPGLYTMRDVLLSK
jgi:4-hydroxy-tetrahydrodipicolinate reductase